MKVKDLIKKLLECDPEAEILIWGSKYDDGDGSIDAGDKNIRNY